MKIYLLQCSIFSRGYDAEAHYENVYADIEKAKSAGGEYLEQKFKEYYINSFDNKVPKGKELTRDELFDLKIIYDFKITEFDPSITDKIEKIDYKYDECLLHEPTHKAYYFDYNGKLTEIEIQYKTINPNKHGLHLYMYPDDFEEEAGTKFKVGDIVKIKEKKSKLLKNYELSDRLHIVTRIPNKKKGQKYFDNRYHVITNHNIFDNGCHEDTFREQELELYRGELEEDSPILFLSKIYKGKIKISKEQMSDLISGNIALNDAPSFRDMEV